MTAVKSRPIGRILRFILGAYMLVLAVPAIAQASLTTGAMIAAVILALLVGYIAILHSVRRFAGNLNRWLGSVHPQTIWDHLANFQETLFLPVLLQSAWY